VLQFTADPFAKAAGACTVSTACTTMDAALDAAIAERKKSLMRINFVDGGAGFICTATLINTEKAPAAYVLTANHCIGNVTSANSITSLWFHESTGCGNNTPLSSSVQVAGGMQLQLANFNVDSTLLLMNAPPPAGASYAPFNPVRLASGAAVVSLSHPAGDTARVARGSITQEYRVEGKPQDMYGVRFTSGIIEGGSSGSGLYTLANGTLSLRGVLSGSTVRNGGGMSCTNLNEEALYGRYEIFDPQIAPYIKIAGVASDDAPNRVQDLFGAPVTMSDPDVPLNARATPELALGPRQLSPAGDLDVFRFFVSATTVVSAWSEGTQDTVGTILDASGEGIESNDDAQTSDTNFGITRSLTPGTYYLQVGHWEPNGIGNYSVDLRADTVGTNYTDLWWNAAESGWGINLNHQGNVLFATLFTYDTDGSQMWLAMSNGARQPDGSFTGTLFRTTGPVFNAVPWSAVTNTAVGTMTLRFTNSNAATLTYTVNGTAVTKSITRQRFSIAPDCGWSHFDRSFADNFQDLWWNPSEPGWGVNFAHQGDTLFATLFTYDASGRGMWLAMSNGVRTDPGVYAGTLFRTRGPAFNAVPWTTVTNEAVGTMTVSFNSGNAATIAYIVNGVTVAKTISRQTFSTPKTECR
jgi:hypothetical protein